jgi:hypothetical protein
VDRRVIAVAATVLAGCASSLPALSSPNAISLYGRWRTEKITNYFADGTSREDTGQCKVEFSGDRLLSECSVGGRVFRVLYAYQVRDPGHYEAEVIEHAVYPTLVGLRSTTAFRVEGDKLFTTAFPPTTSGPSGAPTKIESVSVRDNP